MPEIPPPGIFPLFLRSVTTEKYGFKTGDGVMDLVDHVMIKKDDLTKEIQTLGVMSDFEPAKKYIDGFNGDEILFVVDKAQQYGEIYLVCYTHESRDEYFKKLEEIQLARDEQRKAEEEIEAARLAAEVARRNIQYVDKPLTPRLWKSHATLDTENELRQLNYKPPRELISYEITRLKKSTKLPVRFSAKIGGAVEFRAYRDLNFKGIRESDMGIQVAPPMVESSAQTTWYRPINKSVQYEAPECEPEPNDEKMDDLLDFLERVTMKVESALQQNEAVDIFHETFRMIGDDEIHEGMHAEDELREIKNFADPTYSKSKAVVAIDWLPKMQGMVAVSVVKNVSFDQRVAISGQTSTAHVLLWDFRHLVKPQLIMQSNFEVFAFRFNKTKPGIVAGGTITGQVVLWDVNDIVSALNKQRNQSSRKVSLKAITTETEEDENKLTPIAPKYISHVDHSHKRCVADLLWLPPNTQINYRGQLVGAEHLDNQSYQFVTVAADGMVMIWDIRYEEIALDELKHIGRAKHIPFEKSSTNKDAGKPLWAPIFKAPLKRMEGVGELSLCKVSCSSSLKTSVASNSSLPGDNRSHFMLSTEEGDVIFADICARKSDGFGAAGVGVGVGGQEADEDEAESAREYVRWTARDHPRPCVSLQLSPFFPDILLSVGDWCFHIWKVGEDKPLFSSPLGEQYLTCGAWSPTRPAVLFVACDAGDVMAWDFSDSSFKASITLKATHHKLTSMEFLTTNTLNMRQQLLAAGDETGTLHIFEMPRNLIRPMHKELQIMQTFLEREQELASYVKASNDDDNLRNPYGDTFGSAVNVASETMSMIPSGETKEERAVAASDELPTAFKQALTKEDEDFARMEAAFVELLGIGPKGDISNASTHVVTK